jgi:thiamine pyrophosphokinase
MPWWKKFNNAIMAAQHAAMAELVDALDSGSSRGNSVEVRLFLAAIMKILVVANGAPPSEVLLRHLAKEHDCLVAVDGGVCACLHSQLEPHLLIGDFDSISPLQRSQLANVKQIHTPNQNKSDLEKTLEYLFKEKNPRLITVCGALSQRLDHTLANLYLLCRYPGKVVFETDTERCMALLPNTLIPCHPGQLFSLIPFNTATNVVTQGLQWELKNVSLSNVFFSLSNRCLSTEVSITFSSGDLVACLGRQDTGHQGTAVEQFL